MELSKHYNAADAENQWYKHWETRGYFRSTPDEREPFTIVIPPPNVTGLLHMGHLLNNTVQDILVRRARQQGKNALWVPGTDHASIATEAKVVKMLRERGIKKSDLSREEFLKYAWEWKEEYGGIILEQLKRLGSSCDWERTRFTLEPKLSAAVIKVFVDLYKKGKIYRGNRIINWDPEAQTVLSGEEVLFSEENSKLYHVRYAIEGADNEWITIATTRPETIMGDTAVCVHPDDERYTHLKGKRCIVPLTNRSVPIIFDTYIDIAFGTGALKVTPAHDANDYAIGEKHGLEVVDVFNPDGTMSVAAQFFIGEDRFVVRKKMGKVLEESGNLVKIEDYRNKVGRSERTNSVVEPRLSLQWFVDMKALAAPALEAVMTDEVQFVPEQFKNMYRSWMQEDSIRDWCISRQLWWGQRVPAYSPTPALPRGEGDAPDEQADWIFVAETEAEAYEQYYAYCAEKGIAPPPREGAGGRLLVQDEDALDTWFSSWLWPISVFDGFENQDELNYYYPTSVLVTGFDIIFFWVARMIMAGYEYAPDLLPNKPKYPFKQVYFTGLVRDRLRRKMSKSIGNSPDSLTLLDKYGADGVRFGMLFSAAAGNDIVFDAPFLDSTNTKVADESALCEQGRNFCNKLWNALRLVRGWEITDDALGANDAAAIAFVTTSMDAALLKMRSELSHNITQFRLSEGLQLCYNFIWDDFCSEYLEDLKPAYQQPISRQACNHIISIFEQLMVSLHPFMPFITEEIWHTLRKRDLGDDCMLQQVTPDMENTQNIDNELLTLWQTKKKLVSGLREGRQKAALSPRNSIEVWVKTSEQKADYLQHTGLMATVQKAVNASAILPKTEEPANHVSVIVGTESFYIVLETKELSAEEKAAKRNDLTEKIAYEQGFIGSILKKLENERFVANAKPEVVAAERKKLADGEVRLSMLEADLGKLN
jgi:valyl-tRNA synthetase